MKKTIKIILFAVMIVILNFSLLSNTVQAVGENQVKIYTTGNFNRILKFDGMLIKTARAVYEENGKEYPAYCLNKDLQGVGDKIATYETLNEGKITDVGLWRVIINGYPYKTLEELGVLSEEEAYIATKQSIYCYIYNRGTEKYTGIGEAGNRVVNAMNIILEKSRNSTETLENPQINVKQEKEWKEEIGYISKEYEVVTNINISKYLVQLSGEPEGVKLINLQGQEQKEFNSGEKFKILIPINQLKEKGQFKINIKTQMETKPVFYGRAPSSNLQDYALTAFSFEDMKTELIQEYTPNDTEIKIEKLDEETNQKLSGAIFEILDENKQVIQKQETDENGQINLIQILPGTYYIREIKAPEGYQINDELQKIEIKLNEKITISIGNSKIVIKEEPKEELPEEPTEELPEEPKEEMPIIEEVPKLPVTGM